MLGYYLQKRGVIYMLNSWYKNKFSSQLEELYRLRQSAEGETLVKINDTIEIITSLIKDERESPIFDLHSKLEKNSFYLNFFACFWHIVEPLTKQEKIPFSPRYASIPKLTDEDLFDLIHDFFKETTDREMFKAFRRIYKKREKFVAMHYLQDDTVTADAMYLPYYNQTYIRKKRNHDFDDLADLIHEFGHGIQFFTNFDRRLFYENEPFSEVISMFFELLSMEYFAKMGVFSRAASDSMIILFNQQRKHSKLFTLETEILHSWDTQVSQNRQKTYDMLDQKIEKEAEEFDEDIYDLWSLLDYDLPSKFHYSCSYMFAIELLKIYRQDRDLGLYILRQFMLLNHKTSNIMYYEKILEMGLIPGQNLDEYRSYIMQPIFKSNKILH